MKEIPTNLINQNFGCIVQIDLKGHLLFMQISDQSQWISSIVTISLWTCFHQYAQWQTQHTLKQFLSKWQKPILHFIISSKENSSMEFSKAMHQNTKNCITKLEVHTQFLKFKSIKENQLPTKLLQANRLKWGCWCRLLKLMQVLFNFWRKLSNPNVNDFICLTPQIESDFEFLHA